MRWLKRLIGGPDEEDPVVIVADMLGEPEARMWQVELRGEGIPSLVKTSGALSGRLDYTSVDYSISTKSSDAARSREIMGRTAPEPTDAGENSTQG